MRWAWLGLGVGCARWLCERGWLWLGKRVGERLAKGWVKGCLRVVHGLGKGWAEWMGLAVGLVGERGLGLPGGSVAVVGGLAKAWMRLGQVLGKGWLRVG